MPGETDILTSFLERAGAYAPAKVLMAAAKLGLLSPPFMSLTPDSFARDHGISSRGTRLLLNALVALGIYEKKRDVYTLRENIQTLLERFPGLVQDLVHNDHLYDVWGRLEEGIRSGKSVPPTEEEKKRYPASLAVFLRAMKAHAEYIVSELLSEVSWPGIRSLLDIGGGGGGFALALTKDLPGLKVVIADLPDAVRLTEEILSEEETGDRITCVSCNAYRDPLPEGPFDRVLISHLIHTYPEDENRQLLRKAASRLRPGGDLLLLDYFLNEDETGPREAVLFRLLMMIGTPEGDCYPLSAALEWVKQAGLVPAKTLPLPRGNSLLIARKPLE